ncbi:MAG TPA: hypothetical protein VIQ25_05545 [Gemmatimonadales bacterium]
MNSRWEETAHSVVLLVMAPLPGLGSAGIASNRYGRPSQVIVRM